MTKNKFLYRIAEYLQNFGNPLFTYDVEKQKRYLSKFNEPTNDIERSYNQYKCQMKLHNIFIRIFINIFSVPLCLYYIFKKNICEKNYEHKDAVYISYGIPIESLPVDVLLNYKNIESIKEEKMLLTKQDFSFIKEIFYKYPFSFHFILKIIIKIGYYSYIINKTSPKAIIVNSEYSFTSSAMTCYCNRKNIKHINVMHGEKLFYIRDSFFHFNQCYVWDKFYIDLFKMLRAEDSQFYIYESNNNKFSTNIIKKYDFTYYLQDEKEEEIKKIGNILRELQNKGYKISIRPHPKYSDIKIVYKVFNYCNIERIDETNIQESIMRTRNVISLFSTVLYQAYKNNINVIIDNVTSEEKFLKLKELKYIMLNKNYKLLSQVLKLSGVN